jgi:hypothetical protein
MNEAETRAELIDPLLAAAGWGVVGGPQRWWAGAAAEGLSACTSPVIENAGRPASG